MLELIFNLVSVKRVAEQPLVLFSLFAAQTFKEI